MLKFKNFLTRTGLEEKSFQSECFQWCLAREQMGTVDHMGCEGYPLKGGILALEMGLGKTIIMLGLIECHFQRHTLIILPRSLLTQWEKCIQKFFGHQPLVYHGSRPKNLKLSLSEIQAKPIVLTTYGQVSMPSDKQKNRGRKSSLLHQIQWDRVICDEAHHVSHKNTNEFKGVLTLRSRIRWLVTGTPIQNNEEELYNLFTILGFEQTKNWYKNYDNYQAAVQQFVFHRTKANVGIELPTLHEHMEIVHWANESERQFSSHLHSLLTFCHISKQPIAVNVETEAENQRTLRMQYLSKSRQVCIYPPMLKSTIQHFEKCLKHHNATEDETYANLQIAEVYVSESKINAVVKTLLARLGNGCGKIVFCHYYAEIDIIAKRLQEHCNKQSNKPGNKPGNKQSNKHCKKINISKFDGRITSNKLKQDILQDSTIEILLAQIKMCQEGLNLQDNYSEVYFPSPHFNPATEDQAIARCWRIGQKKEVSVFRYVMIDTEQFQPYIEHDLPIYSMDTYSTWLQNGKRMTIAKLEEAAQTIDDDHESIY